MIMFYLFYNGLTRLDKVQMIQGLTIAELVAWLDIWLFILDDIVSIIAKQGKTFINNIFRILSKHHSRLPPPHILTKGMPPTNQGAVFR